MQDRPNLVIFNPDQLRAESLSCYGHPVVSTPRFDRLAAEGTRFDQCHTTTPLCTPARCSMMTGWYPWTAGHRSLYHLLGPDEPSLFKTLRRAGYQVACFGKNDVFTPGHAAQAVDVHVTGEGTHHGPLPELGDPMRHTFLADPFSGDPDETGDMRSVRRGIELIRSWRPGDQPFVLFLPLSMPHPAYGAPADWHGRYLDVELPSLRDPLSAPAPSLHSLVRTARGFDRLGRDVFRRVQAVYLGMVEYVDWMLGRLLDALDTSHAASATYVMATSDHGDFAGDYGMVEKWHSCLLDVMTRVPMLIRGPGVAHGRCVADPVSLIDLFATVLSIVDVPAEHSHYAQDLLDLDDTAEPAAFSDGGFPIDQPQCFEGYFNDGPADPHNPYFTQTRLHQDQPVSVCRAVSIRTATHRYVHRFSDVSELYDLRSDPRETQNLIDAFDAQPDRRRLRDRLMEHIARTSDVTPRIANSRGWPDSTCLNEPLSDHHEAADGHVSLTSARHC